MRMTKKCWYDMLKKEFARRGDDFEKRVCTLTETELRAIFDAGFGGSEGRPFTAWGENWVYFPVVYNGAEWVGSAPRNPCDYAMPHVGGQ